MTLTPYIVLAGMISPLFQPAPQYLSSHANAFLASGQAVSLLMDNESFGIPDESGFDSDQEETLNFHDLVYTDDSVNCDQAAWTIGSLKDSDITQLDTDETKLQGNWIEEGGKLKFQLADGTYLTGLQQMEDGLRCFLSDGTLVTGWAKADQKDRYFDPDTGLAKTGWLKDEKGWHYLHEGLMQKGWITDKNRYYLDEQGIMVTGWKKLDHKWLYFDGSGAQKTGWIKNQGSWYFLDPKDGSMMTGWIQTPTGYYYLNQDGSMKTGWFFQNGDWYYLDAFSGRMTTGFTNVSGDVYCLGSDGKMVTGWQQNGDDWRYFNENSGREEKNAQKCVELLKPILHLEGDPYVWGGKSIKTGFDCSGLVCYAFNEAFHTQLNPQLMDVCAFYAYCLVKISPEEAIPGDIVIWQGTYGHPILFSHIGIYVGNGKAFQTGEETGVCFRDLDDPKTPYGKPAPYAFYRYPIKGYDK